MCFSATSSFASGAIVTAIGGITLTKIRHPREVLLGSLPLLFGFHQLQEGMVWLWQEGVVSAEIGQPIAEAYVVFAQGLIPVIAPLTVFLVENKPLQRKLLALFAIAGAILSCYSLWVLGRQDVVPRIEQHAMSYEDDLTRSWSYAVAYVTVTCLPLFLSSYRWMTGFAVATLLGLLAATWYKAQALTSVWCAFEAMISVLIYLHFRWVRKLD